MKFCNIYSCNSLWCQNSYHPSTTPPPHHVHLSRPPSLLNIPYSVSVPPKKTPCAKPTQFINNYLAYGNKWWVQINGAETQLCYFGSGVKIYGSCNAITLPLRAPDLHNIIHQLFLPTKTCTYWVITLVSNPKFKEHLNNSKKSSNIHPRTIKSSTTDIKVAHLTSWPDSTQQRSGPPLPSATYSPTPRQIQPLLPSSCTVDRWWQALRPLFKPHISWTHKTP